MPTPNYVNPPTRAPAVEIVCILLGALVSISLVLRLYSRKRIRRLLGVDDIFAIFATVSTTYSLLGLRQISLLITDGEYSF